MRKFFSLATTVIVAAFLAVQPAHAQGLEIGVEAGLNVSDLSVDGADVDDAFESTTGFRFGGILRAPLGPLFGVQTGLSFSQKGADFSDEVLPSGTEASVELDYLEVPILLNLDIPTGPAPVQPRVYAGGNVSFELECEVDAERDDVSASAECASDGGSDLFGADTESVDFGLLFGGGVGVPAGPGMFNVDLRYDLGLTDIFDDVADEVELENRNFQAVAGFSISVP